MNKCFKRIAAIFSVIAIIGATFMGCGKVNDKRTESTNLKTIRLNEVVRSVFYAPMYVAINEGFFEEEGLAIDLSTGQGADAIKSNLQYMSTLIKRL